MIVSETSPSRVCSLSGEVTIVRLRDVAFSNAGNSNRTVLATMPRCRLLHKVHRETTQVPDAVNEDLGHPHLVYKPAYGGLCSQRSEIVVYSDHHLGS